MWFGLVSFGFIIWSLKTNGVAKQGELDVICGALINICGGLTPWVGLPQSTSFLQVRSAPFFKDKNRETRTTLVDVVAAFKQSGKAAWWRPTGPPRIVRESKHSTTATIYFNVWHSTSGTNVKALIGKHILINGWPCTIAAVSKNPRVPCCQNCWQWGHPTSSYRSACKCPMCGVLCF
jgi:hypothetical protein